MSDDLITTLRAIAKSADPYAHDTSPTWDGKADGPAPDDRFTVPEAIATLKYYAARATVRGDTSSQFTLNAAAAAMRAETVADADLLDDVADIATRDRRHGESLHLRTIAELIRRRAGK